MQTFKLATRDEAVEFLVSAFGLKEASAKKALARCDAKGTARGRGYWLQFMLSAPEDYRLYTDGIERNRADRA